MSEAQNKLLIDAFITVDALIDMGVHVGYIIIKKNCTNLNDNTQALLISTDKFGNVSNSSSAIDFQTLYETSSSPQIILNNEKGKFQIKNNSTNNDVFSILNTSNEEVFLIEDDGRVVMQGDLIVSDSDLLRCNISRNSIGVGINPLQDHGFQIGPIPIPLIVQDAGIFMGYDGNNDYGVILSDFGGAIKSNSKPYIGFTQYNQTTNAKIEYDIDENRINFFIKGDSVPKIRIKDNGYIDINGHLKLSGGNLYLPSTENIIVALGNVVVGMGKIGCGTLSPSESLDVVGNAKISGNLNVDGNVLVVDSINNRVGINTTATPTESLDVVGNAKISGILTTGTIVSGITNNKFSVVAGGDTTSNNSLFIKPGYFENTPTNNYITYDGPDTMTHYFWDNLQCSGSLTVNTDALFVNSINKNVGIGTILPESALHVVGLRNNYAPGYGVHIGGTGGPGNFGIEISSDVSGNSVIDFTEPGQNVRGRILYDNITEAFKIRTNDNGTYGMILDSTHNLLIEGTINGNLNSTRGQLISIMGEENSVLNADDYDFNYGNGSVSNDQFGMMIPCSVKLKKFCYAGKGDASDPLSTSITVFQLFSNGTAQSVYAFCDWSNTTNGSKTYHRFSNKFSSSATSQINVEPIITDSGFGINLSWKTYSLYHQSMDGGHRFTVICETQDDL